MLAVGQQPPPFTPDLGMFSQWRIQEGFTGYKWAPWCGKLGLFGNFQKESDMNFWGGNKLKNHWRYYREPHHNFSDPAINSLLCDPAAAARLVQQGVWKTILAKSESDVSYQLHDSDITFPLL